jgi:3'-phosphoadenosine 5'-phosphosulfate sulfotransferase (PAPS reductase)/FAD synthetase
MPLLQADFKIGNGCCNVMKKSPIKSYENKNNMHGFIGTMTDESRQRQQAWLKHGCNAFESKRPISTPISFWSEQDVLRYIKDNDIKIASIYGDIIENDKELLQTTKCDRSGCVFCLYGIQYEEGENRIERLNKTHNQIYNYLINKMNVGKIIDEVNRLCGTNINY